MRKDAREKRHSSVECAIVAPVRTPPCARTAARLASGVGVELLDGTGHRAHIRAASPHQPRDQDPDREQGPRPWAGRHGRGREHLERGLRDLRAPPSPPDLEQGATPSARGDASPRGASARAGRWPRFDRPGGGGPRPAHGQGARPGPGDPARAAADAGALRRARDIRGASGKRAAARRSRSARRARLGLGARQIGFNRCGRVRALDQRGSGGVVREPRAQTRWLCPIAPSFGAIPSDRHARRMAGDRRGSAAPTRRPWDTRRERDASALGERGSGSVRFATSCTIAAWKRRSATCNLGLESQRSGILGEATRSALNVPVERRIRQMELNLERWRWLPDSLGRRRLKVNVPAYQLELIRDAAG